MSDHSDSFVSDYLSLYSEAYEISHVVLLGIILVVVFPFAILSLLKNRSRKDAARRFVPWLKAAFWIFSLTVALQFVSRLLILCLVTEVIDGSNFEEWMSTVRATSHTAMLYGLFADVSAALVMVFLVELGPGMHYAIEGASRFLDRFLRYLAIAVAVVVICLAIALYGMSVDAEVNLASISRWENINYIGATNRILLFIMSLIITSLSVYVFIKRKASPLRNASILYLVSSLLNLISAAWGFAFAVKWLLLDPWGGVAQYVNVLEIILRRWTTGILLVISFFVAAKSQGSGGVWSNNASKYPGMDVENSRQF